MRLAILVTHPVQYFAPIFQELAKQPDLELKVFFGCNHGVKPILDPNFGVVFQWDCEPTAGFEHEFLSTGSLSNLQKFSGIKLATRAVKSISNFKADAVLIFAYTPIFITASTLLLRLAGHKLMLRAETTDEALKRSFIKGKIRQLFLKLYYRQFEHFFPISSNSINHYLSMGVDKSSMTPVRYAIDVDYFQKQVEYWLPQRESLRAAVGIKQQEHVFIYCAKMFPPKNPLLICSALADLSAAEKEKMWFLGVGSGELRSEFEEKVKALLGSRAIFVGFKNQSELGQYYAMADTLILPSQSGETWGLVVNEALQFGLRVIVSDKVGSWRDLVTNSQVGFVFPSGDALALSKAIKRLINCEDNLSTSVDELPHPKQLAFAVNSTLKQI